MTALRNALMWVLAQYGFVRRTAPQRQPWIHIGRVS